MLRVLSTRHTSGWGGVAERLGALLRGETGAKGRRDFPNSLGALLSGVLSSRRGCRKGDHEDQCITHQAC